MITIRGQEFSEDTIVEALKKHCGFEKKEEPYQFKEADIVKCGECVRIIVDIDESCIKKTLISVTLAGVRRAQGQEAFEGNSYRKIGSLRDKKVRDFLNSLG